ncbi:MAG: transglutaminase domain-containing protein [Eubacteriales bacterium]
MKKIPICLLLCLLCGLSAAGCTAPDGEPLSSRSDTEIPSPTVTATGKPSDTTENPDPVTEPTQTIPSASTTRVPESTDSPLPPETVLPPDGSYVCDPYLFYANLSDPGIYADACRLVDAIAAHEDSLTLSDSRAAEILADNIFYNYPPAALCTFKTTADGIDIDYLYPKAIHIEKIAAFYAKTEAILNAVLDPDWSDERKAMELYRWVAEEVEYFTVDYTPADTSAYSAIMQGKSICYGFSDCYNYLLRQAGIRAELLRGYRASDRAEHGWSMVLIDGRWYHCDTTWESGSSDGQGLHYFGMSDSIRFGSIATDAVCGFGEAEFAYPCNLCGSTRYEGVSDEFRSTPWTWEQVGIMRDTDPSKEENR